MTDEELSKMTPEQKRIAIAAACPENIRAIGAPPANQAAMRLGR